MDPSALSVAARGLRDDLAPKLGLSLSQVVIGHPAGAAREQEANAASPRDLLNLFVYGVERDGYPADGSNQDPFYVRAHCLFTAFCIPDSDGNGLSAGEKDLRLIGGVLHWLHAQPSLRVQDGTGAEVAQVQVVLNTLALDELNHLWATQGELPYRLSVSFELALLPVPLALPISRQPRVGALGVEVGQVGEVGEAGMTDTPDSGARLSFTVPRVRVDPGDPAWAPAIRLVDAGGALRYSLAFPATAVPAQIDVVGAGEPGAQVELTWDRWDRASGWSTLGAAAVPLALATDTLDPESAVRPAPTAVPIPDPSPGQLQLTATRTWLRPDGAQVLLRSNPLLLSIHAENGP
jgi:hypothetical protein